MGKCPATLIVLGKLFIRRQIRSKYLMAILRTPREVIRSYNHLTF
jgi:hypothetical protein